MKLHPRVTRTGVELVKRFEGLRRRAARLPGGGWTIGYGHTLTAREGAEVSPEDAEALLYYDLSEVAGKLDAWTFTPLNQNQFEALSAFAFNIGLENFRNSTVLKRVNEGQPLLAGAAMELWRKADFNGEDLVVDALVRRRAAEKAHFLTPPEGFRPAPSPVLRPTFDHSVIEAAAQAQTARQAMVVDVPLDGDTAVAHVEAATERLPEPPAAVAEAPPAPLVQAAPLVQIAPEHPLPLVLEQQDAPEDAPSRGPEPVNDRNGFEAPRFPDPAGAGGFRGFEPPPRRFDFDPSAKHTPIDLALTLPASPQPANQAHAPTFGGYPAVQPEPSGSAEVQAPELTLFNRPLAPPQAAPPHATLPLQGERPARIAADGEGRAESVARTDLEAPASGFLRNRVILYASVGVLGVFLFSIAVGNMAFGKASSATLGTLFMGILGIALMTPAGVWFLMRRLNTPHGDARPQT